MSERRAGRVGLIVRTFVAMVVIVALVVGALTGVLQSLGRKGLYATGLLVDGGASTIDPSIFTDDEATQTALPAKPNSPVLPEATPGGTAQAAKVAEKVRQVGPVGGTMWGQVIDAGSGQVLYENNASGVGVPASTNKLLTCAAALESYGADHRFSTTVVRDPANPQKIYLVGGGDAMLTTPQLQGLAAQAAGALKGTPIEVAVDASLFAGPGWNPAWLPVYRDYAAETSALWVDGARINNRPIGPRQPNPAKSAQDVFVNELKKQGVQISAATEGKAPEGGEKIAEHKSVSLSVMVEDVLIHSNNDVAEVLFRHVGRVDGGSGSIDDARANQERILKKMDAWSDGMRVLDGSGLSREDKASPKALASVVHRAVAKGDDKLYPILTGMSVAGVEGTLAGRFLEEGTQAGRGAVRAKTGTLTEVHSLAGYVRSNDGNILVYSFIINGDKDEYGDRVWLDRVTSALASCGCS